MKIPTFDVSSITKEITTQLTEDYENFVYETITPYCENILQMKVNKEELKRILLLGIRQEQNIKEWLSSFNTDSTTACFTAVQELKKKVCH